MSEPKNYNDKSKVYDIMNTTQSNYSNMLKRLQLEKSFSNFVITYYSIALIVYSLTAVFFSNIFDEKLASYFNIILSIVVLTYSLIITNAKYSERIQAAERVMNDVKAKKRELTDENVEKKREEYEEVMSKAEYRSEIDFFRTLKQKCKKNNIRLLHYKEDLARMAVVDKDEAEKLKEYLSENFPWVQQGKIIVKYIWKGIIALVPVAIFIACFLI
ncbi:SLATT domain-containing protein [Blautia obeum]|uniref:SLATT domain-containing protein n=1 Tax=Blautia obeum TaxID=40520 RepID=UPI001D08BE2C|nr:SLATT domain-containing protein [Blautia obeum]MCB7343987.1 SLATT domain-containing protein [Blautia obeum]